MVNYGRTFHDVPGHYAEHYPSDYLPVYKVEKYKVTHQPLALSNAASIGFSVNWINNDKWKLEQSFSLYLEKYAEEVTMILTDIGNGDTLDNPNYTTNDVAIGYGITAGYQGKVYGFLNDITMLRHIKSGWSLGGGISHVFRVRIDWDQRLRNGVSYLPYNYSRGKPAYSTNQLGLTIHMQKKLGRITGFVKLHQSVLTLKKKENKGGKFFNEGYTLGTASHNLDYRFPLIIRAGLSIGFDKINKKCDTCPF